MKWIKSLVSLPMKVSIWTVLLLLLWAVILGDFGPRIRHAMRDGWAIASSTFTRSVFDAGVTDNPIQELDAIDRVKARVAPQLAEVQSSLRRQQADIAYLRELCRFIEQRFPLNEEETLGAAGRLAELALKAASGDWESEQERLGFEQHGGPQWMAYRQKIETYERAVEYNLVLYERVHSLSERLEERRLATLKLAPHEPSDTEPPHPDLGYSPALVRSHTMLESIHRDLFTALYALDPDLVENTNSVVTVSLAEHAATPSQRLVP